MNRKSQINHVFTYLMIFMVIAVLLIVGVNAWKSIIAARCTNDETMFQSDILQMIDEYSDQGTVKQETIVAPCDAKEICFVDSRYYTDEGSAYNVIDSIPAEYYVIKSAMADRTQNIFVKSDFIEPVALASKLILNQEFPSTTPFKCFQVKNQRIKLVFRGMGRQTQVDVQ